MTPDNHVVVFLLSLVLLCYADYQDLPVPDYTLSLEELDQTMIFDYLHKSKDGANTLDQIDLDQMFNHHPEATPDKNKFVMLITGNQDGQITRENFNKFLNEQPVTFALFECSFIRAKSLRKQCYEDRIVTYVHLVLPTEVISTLYQDTFKAPAGGLTMTEALTLFTDADEHLRTQKTHKFLRELGGKDQVVQEAEFLKYCRQVDLHDDFRACLVNGQYSQDCLKSSLLKYTTEAFTELDIAIIFDSLDDGKDGMIAPGDVSGRCSGRCNPIKFVEIIGMNGDNVIDFGEFRTFMKKETVKIRIEKGCKKDFTDQLHRLDCHHQKLFEIVGDHHTPIWATLPHADILFLFEDLDVDDNGQINVKQDLMKKGYSETEAEKLREEMDGEDGDKTINLQEFNEYMFIPSVIFALSVCKATPRGPDRTVCYNQQLKIYITEILPKSDVETLFASFDVESNGLINKADLETEAMKSVFDHDDKVHFFLKELGMGDDSVSIEEFLWYVRQKDISVLFKERSCGQDTTCMQHVIVEYTTRKMTEIDIRDLFIKLDKDSSREITVDDLMKDYERPQTTQEEAEALLQRMDLDQDGAVNYEEFRLFLIMGGGKKFLEEQCIISKKFQFADKPCLKAEVWNIPESSSSTLTFDQ